MIAPVVITIIFLLYLFIYGAMLMQAVVEEPLAMVYMLFARIREIRSGEEDDLDNY